MGAPKYRIELTEQEREIFRRITRKQTPKQNVVRRAKIMLMADEGQENKVIAARLGVTQHVISTWRTWWLERADAPLEERLQDLPHRGAPGKVTPEQLGQMIALACDKPQDYGRPITHWTHRELAGEAIQQVIVESISSHHLERLLIKNDVLPHRIRYWSNAKADERKDEPITDVCEIYRKAVETDQEILFSVDEMTGIQALERIAPDRLNGSVKSSILGAQFRGPRSDSRARWG